MSNNDPKVTQNKSAQQQLGKDVSAATLPPRPRVGENGMLLNKDLAKAIKQYPGVLGGNPIKET